VHVPNNVPNVSNIENFGHDYEQEISHFDVYDSRNLENLNNKSKDILVEKEISHMKIIQENYAMVRLVTENG
jgi:hypothetical protein